MTEPMNDERHRTKGNLPAIAAELMSDERLAEIHRNIRSHTTRRGELQRDALELIAEVIWLRESLADERATTKETDQ